MALISKQTQEEGQKGLKRRFLTLEETKIQKNPKNRNFSKNSKNGQHRGGVLSGAENSAFYKKLKYPVQLTPITSPGQNFQNISIFIFELERACL